jgi:drug/metabolite transporter (DMT)-like permease
MISQNRSTLGTLYCILSAVAYAVYAVCLRKTSGDYDPAWINCVQASVGTAIFGANLLCQSARGRRVLPPWKEAAALSVIGLITQMGGVLWIWSMSVIGVAVSGTLQMGLLLAGSAVLGLLLLGERVSWPQAAAVSLITASVSFFSIGAPSSNDGEAEPPSTDATTLQTGSDSDVVPPKQATASEDIAAFTYLKGLGAAALGGLAFAVLTIGVRKTVTGDTSPEAVVFLINAMGVVFMGPWCLHQLGMAYLVQTPLKDLGVMLAAGMMNTIGFLLVTLSLQRITVVRVNVLNNGLTMVLTAMAGFWLFCEPFSFYLGLGILLSAAGILLISIVSSQSSDSLTTK